MDDHTCAPAEGRKVFCATCGRTVDPSALRSLRFRPFTGPASLNPNVETFWETGDPSVFLPRPSA